MLCSNGSSCTGSLPQNLLLCATWRTITPHAFIASSPQRIHYKHHLCVCLSKSERTSLVRRWVPVWAQRLRFSFTASFTSCAQPSSLAERTSATCTSGGLSRPALACGVCTLVAALCACYASSSEATVFITQFCRIACAGSRVLPQLLTSLHRLHAPEGLLYSSTHTLATADC